MIWEWNCRITRNCYVLAQPFLKYNISGVLLIGSTECSGMSTNLKFSATSWTWSLRCKCISYSLIKRFSSKGPQQPQKHQMQNNLQILQCVLSWNQNIIPINIRTSEHKKYKVLWNVSVHIPFVCVRIRYRYRSSAVRNPPSRWHCEYKNKNSWHCAESRSWQGILLRTMIIDK